jgi:hypothetical protein
MEYYPEIMSLESGSGRRSAYSPEFCSPKYNTDNKTENVNTSKPDDESFNISHMKSVEQNVFNNNQFSQNKYYNFEESPYQNLESRYNKLKDKYRICKRDMNHWRKSYFNLLKDSLTFDETIKTLYEENRIHMEYIIGLENKVNKILNTCKNITDNFHENISRNMNIDTGSKIDNSYMKNFNEIINDYKKQLEILSDEKEQLNTNLSISRHQQLQYTMKAEELQDRLYRIEQARYDDLKIFERGDNDDVY